MTIFGNHLFVGACLNALRVLKEEVPETFQIINARVEFIAQSPGSGILHSRPVLIFLSTKMASLPTSELAGILAHEACHISLEEGSLLSKEVEERRCIEYQCKILKELGVDQQVIAEVQEAIKTEYWKIPIFKRNW